jgi:hypothetical protein
LQLHDIPIARLLDMSFETACSFILQMRERRRVKPRAVGHTKSASKALTCEEMLATMTPEQRQRLQRMTLQALAGRKTP